jgi:hypothetical protein
LADWRENGPMLIKALLGVMRPLAAGNQTSFIFGRS